MTASTAYRYRSSEAKNTTPSATVGEEAMVPPVSYRQRRSPVTASTACRSRSYEPTYTTPPAIGRCGVVDWASLVLPEDVAGSSIYRVQVGA